ncbi:putative Thioredoxin-like superfamily [Dioscorea sansibarensis]
MAPKLFTCFGRGASSSSTTSSKTPSPDHHAIADQTSEELRRGGPILVELFSSQGCGTSPEAEVVATRLGRGDLRLEVPIVVLVWHVDYWDYRGWKDPFGSSVWTVRQKAFVESLRLDTLYTPQVVVHGRAQCMGTDEAAIVDAALAAPRFPSPTMQATFQKPSPNMLQVSFSGALRSKVDSNGADIMVVLYETGLVTDCERGENRGRLLTNDYVVRCCEKLLTVKDVSAKKIISGSVHFSLWEGFNSSKCAIVLLVQNKSLQTYGVQHIPIPDTI